MGPGEQRIKRVACRGELLENGEGRRGDLLLQNSELELVIRHQADALSLFGLGGGTLVDAAPPGWQDRLIEVIPLVEGGWMQVEEMRWGQSEQGLWVQLDGSSVSLPNLAPVQEGEPVSVRWELPLDSPVIVVQGAQGLYLHGGRGAELLGPGFYRGQTAIQSDARSLRDLGGAVVLEGARRLAIGDWAEVQRALFAQPSAGECEGEMVEALDEAGVVVARMSSGWDTMLPASAAWLRCWEQEGVWGALVPLSSPQSLRPGPAGSVELAVWSGGQALPALVSGPLGEQVVGPEGARFAWPVGRHALVVSAGPEFAPLELDWTVRERREEALSVELERVIHPGDWRLADLDREAWPSWRSRVEPLQDLELAAVRGVSFALQSAPQDVGRPYTTDWLSDRLRVRSGSLSESPWGRVWSMGWGHDSGPGHGAVDFGGLRDPRDLLALMTEPTGAQRLGLVDAQWVQAAGAPWSWEPNPTALMANGPEDLGVVMELAAHGERVSVAGPLTWLRVPDTELPGISAFERALVMGDSVATTGPWLSLEQRDWSVMGAVVAVDCQAGLGQVQELQLWVDGELLRSGACGPALYTLPLGASWVTLLLAGDDWAMTTPLFLR